ncbi:MAG: cell division protein FtsA [Leptospiraceae bacterium]|nr:MAG: cell division protein FtsA [Leptospiraceae bacterium]
MIRKICAVDIGTSITKVIIANIYNSEIEIIGIGTAETHGIRSAEIINMESVSRSIQNAIREAEKMCAVQVNSVYVNISGINIKGENSTGIYVVSNEDRIITSEDVERVVENATNINIPSEYQIIHVLSREYIVDKKNRVPDPIGMTGFRLEANVHIVTAPKLQIKNIYKVFYKMGLEVNDVILNSIASSEAVLKEEEKNLGCIMIDFGYAMTDVIIYVDGGVFHTLSIPLGSFHLTSDLEYAFKIPFEIAEFVKKRDGIATIEDVDPTVKIEIPSTIENPRRLVHLKDIALVLEARLEEIFEIVLKIIKKKIDPGLLSSGIILTGGGSLLQGIERVAERIFSLPVRLGKPRDLKGLSSEINSPEFSTAVGIIKFVAKQFITEFDEYREKEYKPPIQRDKKLLNKIKNWIAENI